MGRVASATLGIFSKSQVPCLVVREQQGEKQACQGRLSRTIKDLAVLMGDPVIDASVELHELQPKCGCAWIRGHH